MPDTVALGQVYLRLRQMSSIRIVKAMDHSHLCLHFHANSCQKDERLSLGTFKQGSILLDNGQLRAAPGSTVTLLLDDGNMAAN